MSINCALDGPSGAGKSTIAKSVAKRMGYVYVDTGALYRSIGLYIVRKGIDTKDREAVAASLNEIEVDLKYVNGEQTVWLNNEDVSGLIRTNEISMAASDASAIPAVRDFLLELQRGIAAKNDIIMDGRDIGTVILPNAQVKVFMTASAEERASRRYKELIEKGQNVTYEEVLRDINQRDYNDSHRETSPLKQADDAVLLDTTSMTIEEAASAVCDIINSKIGKEGLKKNSEIAPVVKKHVGKVRTFFYSIFRLFVRTCLRVVYSLNYEGKENVPDHACIVAPNHLTWADPVFVAAGIRNPSAYMAKESIFEHKISVLLKIFHAFPVKRDTSDRGALKTSVDYLNKGYNLTIFPEGTRSKDGKLGKAKSGVAYICSAAGADVLPVGIIFEKQPHRRTKLTIRYGKPISKEKLNIERLSSSELRRARDLIMNEIGALTVNENS